MRYFAYGPNVNPDRLSKKQLAFTERMPAKLPDFGIRFNKKNLRETLPETVGFANIVDSPGEVVEGVLYTLSDELAQQLDQLEHAPDHYRRVEVTVDTPDGPITGVTYQASPEVTADGLQPSRNYLNQLLTAGQLFSHDYRAALQRTEAFAGECAACHVMTEVQCHREGNVLYVMCAPCLEAKRIWGDALGRTLSVLDTEAVMQHILRSEREYDSIAALISDATRLGLLAPA